MKELQLDSKEALDRLIKFITDTVLRAGYGKVVLGVSGGVDSSLSAFLSVRALGPEKVLCLRLPYKTSSQASLDHAQMVIDRLGVRSKTIDISPVVDAVLANYPGAGQVRRGNIMARVRMIHIYDHSASFPGLVVGTGNKTESLLGYSTLHGDGAFDFNPLADLYKAQVRQLAEEVGVPGEIIAKAPSADLWVGQTDEEELGYSYDEMDRLLYLLVEKKFTVEDCLAQGLDPEFVNSIISRVMRYRYKSKPPLAGSVGQVPLDKLEELPFFQT